MSCSSMLIYAVRSRSRSRSRSALRRRDAPRRAAGLSVIRPGESRALQSRASGKEAKKEKEGEREKEGKVLAFLCVQLRARMDGRQEGIAWHIEAGSSLQPTYSTVEDQSVGRSQAAGLP